MLYTYVLMLPSSETVTVRDITEDPDTYAALLPSGWSIVSYEVQSDQPSVYPTYRLIIETSPGRVDTGATLPSCTREHPDLCDPRQFANTPDAFAYGEGRGEIPNSRRFGAVVFDGQTAQALKWKTATR